MCVMLLIACLLRGGEVFCDREALEVDEGLHGWVEGLCLRLHMVCMFAYKSVSRQYSAIISREHVCSEQ